MKSKGKILIISGNTDLQNACQQALCSENLFVQLCDSVHQGVEKARQEEIDIILLDGEILCGQQEVMLLQRLWENNAEPVCLLLSKQGLQTPGLQAFQAEVCGRTPAFLLPEHLFLRGTQALEQPTHVSDLKRCQLENLKKTVEWILEKRIISLEMKRLLTLEHNVAPLWAVAKGEIETSDLFGEAFLGPAAFRLTLAHEFRAPLTALQSFLLILLRGYVAPEKWKEIVQHAYDRSQDLLSLVDDLMNLAAARQKISMESCSEIRLGDELERLAPSLRAEANWQGIAFTLAVRQNPPVRMNPFHLSQLWTNLISNAIKYTPSGGTVIVSVDQDETWAIGAVEDSGIGIGPQELPLIFNEFYRTAEAKKVGARGTGLGLPLVKRIVEGYGGNLEVKSTVGKGSLFRFTLPLAVSSSSKDPAGEQSPT